MQQQCDNEIHLQHKLPKLLCWFFFLSSCQVELQNYNFSSLFFCFLKPLMSHCSLPHVMWKLKWREWRQLRLALNTVHIFWYSYANLFSDQQGNGNPLFGLPSTKQRNPMFIYKYIYRCDCETKPFHSVSAHIDICLFSLSENIAVSLSGSIHRSSSSVQPGYSIMVEIECSTAFLHFFLSVSFSHVSSLSLPWHV